MSASALTLSALGSGAASSGRWRPTGRAWWRHDASVDGRLVAALHDGTQGVGLGTNGIRQQGHRRLRFWVPPSALRTDRDTTPSSAARRNVSSRHAVAARFTEKAAGPSWLLPEAEDMAMVVAAASTESAPLSPTLPISTSGALRRALPWPTFSSPTSPPPAARGRCSGDTPSPQFLIVGEKKREKLLEMDFFLPIFIWGIGKYQILGRKYKKLLEMLNILLVCAGLSCPDSRQSWLPTTLKSACMSMTVIDAYHSE